MSAKLQKSDHFWYLRANRPLANLGSSPPLPTLKPNSEKMTLTVVEIFFLRYSMILSRRMNKVSAKKNMSRTVLPNSLEIWSDPLHFPEELSEVRTRDENAVPHCLSYLSILNESIYRYCTREQLKLSGSTRKP